MRRPAAALLVLAIAAASAATVSADNPKQPRDAGAKEATTTFVVHDILVRPFITSAHDQQTWIKLHGKPGVDTLPKGRVVVVSVVRALYEKWQVVVLGPERLRSSRGDRFTIELPVYRNTDCTPYDPVFVQMDGYLIPDGTTLPSKLDVLLQEQGLVAEGTEPQVRAVRQQLAQLAHEQGVIPLGHFGDTFTTNPEDDPAHNTNREYDATGAGQIGRIRWEWSNEYRTYGACASGASPGTTTTSTGESPTYTCNGSIVKLFDNTNGASVAGGGTPPTFDTGGKPYCVTSITTYHWNGGRGAPPGSVGLTGSSPVPYSHASGEAGQNGAQNANWVLTFGTHVGPVVIDGTYACRDSDPATWSQNAGSGGKGFCVVYGIPAQRS